MYEENSLDWVFGSVARAFGKPFTRADVRSLIDELNVPLPSGEVEGEIENPHTSHIENGHVSRETALWQRLNKTLAVAGREKQEAEKLEPGKLRDRFRHIISAIADLKQALGAPESASPGLNEWDFLDQAIWKPLMHAYSREGKTSGTLLTTISSLNDLSRWARGAHHQAELAVRRTKGRAASSMSRNQGRRDLAALFSGLSKIWIEVWGQEPTRNSREPFAKFCRLVLKHAGRELEKRQLNHQLSKVAPKLD